MSLDRAWEDSRKGSAIIEGEGGGIREVFRACKERGLSRPQLIDTGVQSKALLWRPAREGGEGAQSGMRQIVDEKSGRPPELHAYAA